MEGWMDGRMERRMDGRTKGRMNKPYFVGPFQLPLGLQKAKGVNKNIVVTISHNEWIDVLLNKNCIRQSMNGIQSKDHRMEIYEINNISLSYFGDKIYIQNNGYDRLALGY